MSERRRPWEHRALVLSTSHSVFLETSPLPAKSNSVLVCFQMRPVAQSGIYLSDCLAVTSSTWDDPRTAGCKVYSYQRRNAFPWAWKTQSEVMVWGSSFRLPFSMFTCVHFKNGV